jgi:hypothetical protein
MALVVLQALGRLDEDGSFATYPGGAGAIRPLEFCKCIRGKKQDLERTENARISSCLMHSRRTPCGAVTKGPAKRYSRGLGVAEVEGNQALESDRLPFLSLSSAEISLEAPVFNARIHALRVLIMALLEEIEMAGQTPDLECPPAVSLSDEVRRFEAEMIRNTLLRTGGRQRRAARLLGMKVTTLHAKIRRYSLDSLDGANKRHSYASSEVKPH